MDTAARLTRFLVKTASRCNFDCSYCYVYRGRTPPGIFNRNAWVETCSPPSATASSSRRNARRRGSRSSCTGGNRCLLGFSELAELLRGLRWQLSAERHPISIQTNGALLSGRHLDLFAETRTSVSVSIDGPPEANDLARVDHRGESTFAATSRGIHRLASHPESGFLFAGTLSVVQPAVVPGTVYAFLKTLGTPSMDFLLQDGNHDRLPRGKAGFDSTEYGEWLNGPCSMCISRIPRPSRFAFLTT